MLTTCYLSASRLLLNRYFRAALAAHFSLLTSRFSLLAARCSLQHGFTPHQLPLTRYPSPATTHQLLLVSYPSPATPHQLPLTSCL